MKGFSAAVIFGVCAAMALPIVAAAVVARYEAYHREQRIVSGLAREALLHSEAVGQQLEDAAHILNAIPKSNACSERALAFMRTIDLGSTLLQAVAHREGEVIDCSSVADRRPLALGKPDLISAAGNPIWTNVRLWDGNDRYLLVGSGSFVGVIHRDLPLSFVESFPGAIVGTFNWSHRIPLVQRGDVPRALIRRNVETEETFRSGKYSVSIARSKRYDIASIAAVPLFSTVGFGVDGAIFLIPIGIVSGLILSALLLRAIKTRSSMPGMIRHALKFKEFYLVYQPVVALDTGRTVGAEALIRWRRANGDIIPADVFVAAAENNGLIDRLTEYVFDYLGGSNVAEILRICPAFRLGVNISAMDLQRPTLMEDIKRFSARAAFPISNLVVEITERGLIDLGRARSAMSELRQLGAKLAIDDFGTGYSSLSYLAELKLDILKIDKLFIHAVGTQSATSHVVMRIVEIARDLDIDLVAEGVETRQQLDWLKADDIDFAQGYLFSQPMPIEALLQLLRDEQTTTPAALRSAAG